MSKNPIMLKTQGIRLPSPNGVKTASSADFRACNIVLRSVWADFPEPRVQPATIGEFKQIEFLDPAGGGMLQALAPSAFG
jgi:hypothetical protein